MLRSIETQTTKTVLEIELQLLLKLYALADKASKLDALSVKWRKRLQCFHSDTMMRLLLDLQEDIELLKYEQSIFGD